MACQSATSKAPPAPTASALSMGDVSPRRFKIYFEDDAVRARSEATVRQLLKDATTATTDCSSNTALLAKKALKYRKVLDRIKGVDMTSPSFNAAKFLGVDWCKTADLKAYCDSQQ